MTKRWAVTDLTLPDVSEDGEAAEGEEREAEADLEEAAVLADQAEGPKVSEMSRKS